MTVQAKIRWLRTDEGGRPSPPAGPMYSTVARFEGQTEEAWLKEAWSLILDLEGTPDENLSQIARTRFLAEDAPHEWLEPSRSFALYEGLQRVAEGVVLAGASEDEQGS